MSDVIISYCVHCGSGYIEAERLHALHVLVKCKACNREVVIHA